MTHQNLVAGSAVETPATPQAQDDAVTRKLEDCLSDMRATLIRFAVANYAKNR